jgi:hypothetical protein
VHRGKAAKIAAPKPEEILGDDGKLERLRRCGQIGPRSLSDKCGE